MIKKLFSYISDLLFPVQEQSYSTEYLPPEALPEPEPLPVLSLEKLCMADEYGFIEIDLEYVPDMMKRLMEAQCRKCNDCIGIENNRIGCINMDTNCKGKKLYSMRFEGDALPF